MSGPRREVKLKVNVFGLRRRMLPIEYVGILNRNDLVPYTISIVKNEVFAYELWCNHELIGIYDTQREAESLFCDTMKRAMKGEFAGRDYFVETDSDDSLDTLFDFDDLQAQSPPDSPPDSPPNTPRPRE